MKTNKTQQDKDFIKDFLKDFSKIGKAIIQRDKELLKELAKH